MIKKRGAAQSNVETSHVDLGAFNEELSLKVFETFGQKLVETKQGLEIANFLRELCSMSNKAFLNFLFSKELCWDFGPHVRSMQKKLAQAVQGAVKL
jgi:hypothetical protein